MKTLCTSGTSTGQFCCTIINTSWISKAWAGRGTSTPRRATRRLLCLCGPLSAMPLTNFQTFNRNQSAKPVTWFQIKTWSIMRSEGPRVISKLSRKYRTHWTTFFTLTQKTCRSLSRFSLSWTEIRSKWGRSPLRCSWTRGQTKTGRIQNWGGSSCRVSLTGSKSRETSGTSSARTSLLGVCSEFDALRVK